MRGGQGSQLREQGACVGGRSCAGGWSYSQLCSPASLARTALGARPLLHRGMMPCLADWVHSDAMPRHRPATPTFTRMNRRTPHPAVQHAHKHPQTHVACARRHAAAVHVPNQPFSVPVVQSPPACWGSRCLCPPPLKVICCNVPGASLACPMHAVRCGAVRLLACRPSHHPGSQSCSGGCAASPQMWQGIGVAALAHHIIAATQRHHQAATPHCPHSSPPRPTPHHTI
jgi:hypothetical protein